MIQPINQNLNVSNSNNLKPVEVPHFTGFTKVKKEEGDSFQKAVENAEKNAKKAVKNKTAVSTVSADNALTVKLKKSAAETFDAAKAGTKEGVKVIKDVTKKSVEFTGSLAKSLYEDLSQVVKEKGIKTITTMDGII